MLVVSFRSVGLGQSLRVPALVLDGEGALWQMDEGGRRSLWLSWRDGTLTDQDGNRVYDLQITAQRGRLALRGGQDEERVSGVKLSSERHGMSWPVRYRVLLHGLKKEGWLASTQSGGWHSVLASQPELLLCPLRFSLPVPKRPPIAYVRSRISPLGYRAEAGPLIGWTG